jgi:cell wall-associated NlpC family hydrolase
LSNAERVLKAARSWLGLDFKPGCPEQCAAFVRAVFGEAGVPLAVSSRPRDFELTQNLEQGPEYANSFFGDEVGPVVSWEEALPGDLLAFRDTYEGDFPPGCITHVGIFAGEGQMIDRSTRGTPVREIALEGWWREHLVEIRRPLALL